MGPLQIGLIGDHDPAVTAHRAIPLARERAAAVTGAPVEARWLHSPSARRSPGAIIR